MKKFITVSAAAVLAFAAMGALPVSADDALKVNVTIADAEGKLAVVQEQVEVTDADSDGALTINDALILAHDKFYEGGSEAGYGSSVSQYGLGMTKLWGSENGGSYGYYVNNTAAMSLADTIKDGDYINAFVYTDLTGWSDKYCWFNENTLSANDGDTVELTLSAAGYDASWNPVTLAVEGAVITVDGEATEYKTDAEGKVSLPLTAGSHVISAKSDSEILVPPALKAEVAGETTSTTTTVAETSTTTSAAAATTTTTAAVTSAAATTTGTSSPKTGDSVPAVGIAAFAGIAALVLARKKNED
ncbi:MAG: hypothetical protein IJM44_04225 [Ruminococcus sp.]|nr:hypothetical protein [Ruminococcus sp.]